jgi:SAM-dependent methyltransferase
MYDPIVQVPRREQIRRINKYHKRTRHRPGKRVPVTGRSAKYYAQLLYPDVPMMRQVRRQPGRLLDVGSGCNHLHPDSLLWRLKGRGLGLDIEDRFPETAQYRVRSLFRTGLPKRSVGTILSNNVLYYWIDTHGDLLKAFRECVRILRPGGEMRIFPVFFGNYHLNSPELYHYLHRHFWLRLLTPRYSKESPLMYFGGEVVKTGKDVGEGEQRMMRRLHAQTLVLQRA